MLATSFYPAFPFQYLPQHPSASGVDFSPHHPSYHGTPFGGPSFACGRPTLRGGFHGFQTPLGPPPPGFGLGRGTFGLGFHIGNDFDDHHQYPFCGGRGRHPNHRGRGVGHFRGHVMHHPGRAFTEDFMFARPGFDVPREHLESSGSESSGSFPSGEVSDGDENRPSKNTVREGHPPSAHGKHHHHGRCATRGFGRKSHKINMSKEQASEALPTSGERALHNDELRDESGPHRHPFEHRAGLHHHHHRHHRHHRPYGRCAGAFRGGPIRTRGMHGLGRGRGGACQLCFFLEETDSETEMNDNANDERLADSNATRNEQDNNQAIQIDDNDSENFELTERLSVTNIAAEGKEKVDEEKVGEGEPKSKDIGE